MVEGDKGRWEEGRGGWRDGMMSREDGGNIWLYIWDILSFWILEHIGVMSACKARDV